MCTGTARGIASLLFGTCFLGSTASLLFGTQLFAATGRRLLRLELFTKDLARVAHGQVRRLRFAETFFRGNWEELDRLLPQLVELGLSECVVLLFTPLCRHEHACRRFWKLRGSIEARYVGTSVSVFSFCKVFLLRGFRISMPAVSRTCRRKFSFDFGFHWVCTK